jgi:hypothetical protein
MPPSPTVERSDGTRLNQSSHETPKFLACMCCGVNVYERGCTYSYYLAFVDAVCGDAWEYARQQMMYSMDGVDER